MQTFSSRGERGLLLAAVCGRLIAEAPLVVGHRPQGTWASAGEAHSLSCPAAWGRIFPDQGFIPSPPGMAGGFLATRPAQKSSNTLYFKTQ